jgi:predicted RNase H-like HicB family nuclease
LLATERTSRFSLFDSMTCAADHFAVHCRVSLFESDEGWAVSCPDLLGCHSRDSTREEALTNIKDAIRLWLKVEAEETGLKRIEQAEVAI